MSRKVILTLASAVTIAAVGLGSSAADARSFAGGLGGGHFAGGRVNGGTHFAARNGGRSTSILNPGHPGGHPPGWAHGHHHGHWIFRGGRWIIIDGVDAVDVVDEAPVAAPGPCTCLTKTYTPDGLVVFADVCTKEAASARVDGGAAAATPLPPAGKSSDAAPAASPADVSQGPTSPNYAGRTYQDYLAASAQAAAQLPQKN